jgi:hypothetical protein
MSADLDSSDVHVTVFGFSFGCGLQPGCAFVVKIYYSDFYNHVLGRALQIFQDGLRVLPGFQACPNARNSALGVNQIGNPLGNRRF